MSKDSFDKLIKDKMADFSAHQEDNDVWSRFESAHPDLNTTSQSTDIDDDIFDDIIRHNLRHFTSTYKSDHWKILKARMALTQERNSHTYISKLTEIAAIFLLVFSFSNWSGWLDRPQIESPNLHPELFATNHHSNNNNNNNNNGATNNTAHGIVSSKNNGTNAAIYAIENFTDNDGHPTCTMSSSSNSTTKITEYQDFTINDDIEIPIPTENNHFELVPQATPIDVRSVLTEWQQQETKQIATVPSSSIRMVASLNALPLMDAKKLESEFARIFPMQMSKISQKPSYALSVYGAADINLINTPFDKLYSKASYNKEALNNSYGINISKKTGHLEIESGLGYANRTYQPQIINEEFAEKDNSYSEISLNKISYHIANIPLNFKWHFIDQASWKAYVTVGAALNLVAHADYGINEIEVQGRPTLSGYLRDKPRLEEKEFIQGILSGGNFKDNYFASVGFGFGIEKKLVNNTYLYVQPSYQRQILTSDIGIGPNKDKIHTSSLQFGIKTILN